jgi:hypothetical protein
MEGTTIPENQQNTQVYSPGSIIKNRSRLWRVDEVVDDILTATSIDGGNVVRHRFLIPFEETCISEVLCQISQN